jgi:hypothetical protein
MCGLWSVPGYLVRPKYIRPVTALFFPYKKKVTALFFFFSISFIIIYKNNVILFWKKVRQGNRFLTCWTNYRTPYVRG